MRRFVGSLVGVVLSAGFGFVPSAQAWGCKGHQVVALIAEQHLNAHARTVVDEILLAAPISSDLRRFCGNTGLDAFADSSTWADDERTVRPETADWHFIDIPRGVTKGNLEQYCPPSGCVTQTILAQLAVLRDAKASPQARGDALRFLIHFVGDLHQPLHATTNNDQGGNCVPVAYFGNAPQQTDPVRESYRPNLHGIWDTDILERFSQGKTSPEVAEELQGKFKKQLFAWQSEKTNVAAWAWESYEAAEKTVYGKLPSEIAVETPKPVMSCADADHISTRMLRLGEVIGDEYQSVAAPVVEERLAQAGARLAATLNALWP
jgi:hypothetical protein